MGGDGIRAGQQITRDELAVHVLRGLRVAGDERDLGAHDVADRALEEGIVRASEHESVDAGVTQRSQILLRHTQHVRRAGDARLDEFHETGTRLGEHGEVFVDTEHVLVDARADGAERADDADAAISGRRDGCAHGRPDDLDHRHVVALARIAQHGGGCRVAGDHEHLHTLVDERVQDLEAVAADVGYGLRAVRRVRRVADVEHGFAGQQLRHSASHREAADAGVEDPDRRVIHDPQPYPPVRAHVAHHTPSLE